MSETANKSIDESGESKANGPTTQNEGAGAVGDALELKIADLERQLKEKDAKYLYLYADFENFKKRSIKEREETLKFGWENVAANLLETLDNLERALSFLPENADKNLAAGLKMVHEHFLNTLKKQGVERIKAMKQSFDPNLHEAVSQESSDEPEQTVIHEIQPGYTLHGRLLRPARVVVSAGQGT